MKPKMKLYDISADGGTTWTKQWLTEEEYEKEQKERICLVQDGSASRRSECRHIFDNGVCLKCGERKDVEQYE